MTTTLLAFVLTLMDLTAAEADRVLETLKAIRAARVRVRPGEMDPRD